MDDYHIITPDMILPLMTGEMSPDWESGSAICEDIVICRVDNGVVTGAGCSHPVHGCHPRFKAAQVELLEGLESLKAELSLTTCPWCEGTGWLSLDTLYARQAIVFGSIFGLYRGIKLPSSEQGEEPSLARVCQIVDWITGKDSK